MLCQNCRFEHAGGFVIGIGCLENQTQQFVSCQFVKTGVNVAEISGASGFNVSMPPRGSMETMAFSFQAVTGEKNGQGN